MIPNLLLVIFLPKFIASSIVSGNLSLVVSGKLKARIPANVATAPKITNVRGGQKFRLPFINRANIPPTRAIQEQVPIAVLLMVVGNSSEVYKYTMPNPKAADSLPIMTRINFMVTLDG